ncbi:ribosomal protein L9 [Acrasis kona]|uniref:Ribosomal protein L9 n=1 Tax=Acrasis kona TaxID=1008807 RepID=A0AAW2YQ14_9EUKA
MKTLSNQQTVEIPEGIKISAKSRIVTVTGARGTLKKSFRHLALDMTVEGNTLLVQCWHGDRKHNAQVRTVCSAVENLITGVTKGYKFKMRFVYAHFPVNINITEDNKIIEIRNFLGEKFVRRVEMIEGVTVKMTGNKDEIQVEGNSLDSVSQSCANIHGSTLVKNKDIRKFLDGIYVSERGHIVEAE